VIEERLLRVIFGNKRGDIISAWRKVCIEELNVLYCSQNILLVKIF
jgi:hypothetical protein